MDTIFALSSAFGKSGVAVFRVSGPNSYIVIERLTDGDITKIKPRIMYLRKIFNPISKQQIDQALIVYFNSGCSFTGEKVVELHVHGSRAVVKILFNILSSIGFRLAEPGEFTKRAFINGKFDLTAAEGLADLIDAETELQHTQAIRQLEGGLEKIYEDWRRRLIKLIAFLEASIDFPDEEISYSDALTDSYQLVQELKQDIIKHLDDNNRGERLREGLRLVICGEPNVGKSTLINFLIRREVAIVSDIAGTTRDVIEGHIDISGYPINIYDTAGIRNDSKNTIEQLGIEKAKSLLKKADIKIIIYDITNINFCNNDYLLNLIDENTIIIFNKIDLVDNKLDNLNLPKKIYNNCPIFLSFKSQIGLEKIISSIINIAEKIAAPTNYPQITRARHRIELTKVVEFLSSFAVNTDLVLATEDIRLAIRKLASITGKINVDDILNEVFSNFCIGK